MSWGLRAHIRNLVLRASMGSSYASSAELRKGSNAKCTVDLCPYPRFSNDAVSPPPTDDPKFVADNVHAAFQNFASKYRVGVDNAPILRACVFQQATNDLVCDLFWYCYLQRYGIHHAARHESHIGYQTFREVLTQVFVENDIDDSGSVDAAELSALLGRLDVALPPECCADLIAVVDTDGNGSLDLEEFLAMMCIEIISDVFIDDAKADAQRLHQRCSSRFCAVVSPLQLELSARDVVQPAYCMILSEAVHRCFEGTFGMRGDGESLRAYIEECVMKWFVGMRQPFQERLLAKRRSSADSGACARKAGGVEKAVIGRTSRTGLAPVPPALAATASEAAKSSAEIDDLRGQLAQLRRRGPAPPKEGRPSTSRVMKVASLSQAYHAHPGQRAPPVPVINLAGCSEAFNEAFRTPRPHRPLHTLSFEHMTWGYRPLQHAEFASKCANWRNGKSVHDEPVDEAMFRLPAASQRTSAKVARRYHLARVERAKELEILALREWSKMQEAIKHATNAEQHHLSFDNVEAAVNDLTGVRDRINAFLGGPLLRNLPLGERRTLQTSALDVGKRLAKHTREIRFRQLRSAHLEQAGSERVPM